MKTRLVCFSFVLLLALTACNLQIPGDQVSVSPIDSIQGTWTGTLIDSKGGNTYDAQLILEQIGGGTTIQGTLTLTDPTDSNRNEVYAITGEYDGRNVRFNEPEGRFFWGTADSAGIRGQAGWCDQCDAWGEFSLTLQTVPTTRNDSASYSIQLAGLQDGDTITPAIGENGLPVVESTVDSTGPMPASTAIALEADGLWVSQALTDGTDPFSITLQWTPWHGNGEYALTIQALTSDLLATQTIHVTITGIPDGIPTVQERMIRIYQEQFGLTLTAPAFARYTKPDPYALEDSRWVSAAYIGDKMYEVSIFDNGFAGGMSYDLSTGGNGFCRPAGIYSMLVLFVDYGNTGLDPALGAAPMEEWRLDANQRWTDYSTSIGLTEPILQIDRLESVIISAPPVPGQTLTVDQVRTLTGKDPSNFDWLVEIDLDATNTFSGQYGGVGISLNGGCLPGGAQRVNIAFSAMDEKGLLTDAPGSVFAHELEHGMGWQHWWPNELANNAGLMTRTEFWMPTLLFGWTDTDGDGTIEILDPETPYGLVP